jgi:hypothetical protein
MNDWEIDSINGIPDGWTVIDDAETTPYVTFKAEEDNSSIGLALLSTNQTLEYSTDTINWDPFDTTTDIPLNNGDEVYVRGVLSEYNTYNNYTQFKMSGKIAASGNCNAIWNYEDLNAPLKVRCGNFMFGECESLTTSPELPATTLTAGCYSRMFEGCSSLTKAPELPATVLDDNCYNNMFHNCISLTVAPELPATTLSYACYSFMFSGCNSLAVAPELPATELARTCYQSMFSECTSLTVAPELPATTLIDWCYNCMFQSCTSLTTAPELPAAVLTKNCYSNMFDNCTSLNYIKCLSLDISAEDCTRRWVSGVSDTGTFVKHQDMNDWEIDSINGIPIGWTVIKDGETTPYVTFTAEEDNS